MDIQVRPLDEDQILLLDQVIKREPFTHYERFLAQRSGSLVYLVAWLDELPVGMVMVRWVGKPLARLAFRYPHCAHLLDLYVVTHYRSNGIGTNLLLAAEQSACERGHQYIGLSVALENKRARALYERRGYRDIGLEPYTIEWTRTDTQGKAYTMHEECIYLVKDL